MSGYAKTADAPDLARPAEAGLAEAGPHSGTPADDAVPRLRDFLAYAPDQFHRIAYADWGDPESPDVVVCVHGLSRQGRDFDHLARALVRLGYRVVCPDLVGRGRSGRLRDPYQYGMLQYCADMAALVAHLGLERLSWVGTSLGGLIGMMLAAADATPVRRFVINDIGPFLPWAPVRAIADRLRGAPHRHPDLTEAERRLRFAYADFGPLTDDHWRHLTEHSFVEQPGGGFRPHYDPGISKPFEPGRVYSVSLWKYWDAIRCPTLLIRGAESKLLLETTADEMTRRGPKAARVDLPGIGHAPALLDDDQIRIVTDWLGPAGSRDGSG